MKPLDIQLPQILIKASLNVSLQIFSPALNNDCTRKAGLEEETSVH